MRPITTLLFSVAAITLIVPTGTKAAQSSSAWVIQNTLDPLTDRRAFEAVLTTSGVSNGHTTGFVVKANCAKETGLDFDIRYTVPRGADQHFRPLNNVRPGMRFRIDNEEPVTILFQSLGPDRIRIGFSSDSGNALDSILTKTGLADFSITAARIFAAQRIRLEFPFENGDSPILDISPQSASFKAVADHCNAIFSAPPIHEVEGSRVRFVPLTSGEMAIVERAFWLRRAGESIDFASRFKDPQILPPGTQWVQAQIIGPDNLEPNDLGGPGRPSYVNFPVGASNVTLAKLQDGRVGLIPDVDWQPDLMSRFGTDPIQQIGLQLSRKPKVFPRPDQEFSGTAEEFAKVLPEFTRKTAAALGIDPASYQPEEAVIIDLVRRCAELTPKMLQSPNDPSVRITDFRTLAGGKYADCNNQMDVYFAPEKVRAARGEPPMKGLDPNHREYLLQGPHYMNFLPDGKTFMVKVYFNQKLSDDAAFHRRGDTTPGISQQDRIVVEATIHSNASIP